MKANVAVVLCSLLLGVVGSSSAAEMVETNAEKVSSDKGGVVGQKAIGKLPVKEIAVFKDGHAFVVHEGTLPTDGNGDVVLDYLPRPMLGTFWPYSVDDNAKLVSASAGKRRVRMQRTALDLVSLIQSNVGRNVMITEAADKDGMSQRYAATIAAFPTRSSEELAATSGPDAGESLPKKGEIVLLKTDKGTKALPLGRVQDVTFVDAPNAQVSEEEFRNLLTLKMEWKGRKPASAARVGFAYVEKGIRWIPSYKVTLDDKGNARVQLQATLINEVADLENVTANLIVGVPSFAFKDMMDPLSMQATLAQVSVAMPMDSRWSNMLSNSAMTQVPTRATDQQSNGTRAMDLGPDVKNDGRNEDLFLFTVKGVSLRKGERMVLPVTEFALPCKDLYKLNIPFGAPNDMVRQFSPDQQQDIARLLAAPKVMHLVRLKNTQKHPLTTGPALILKGDRVLAQSMMTYTPTNAEVDLDLTAAINILAGTKERETKRNMKAMVIDGNTYTRIDQAGEISLTNRGGQAVEVEVVRSLGGGVDRAEGGAKVDKIGVADKNGPSSGSGPSWIPEWWWQVRWPDWYGQLNASSQVKWNVSLKPGETVSRSYAWHYFWR